MINNISKEWNERTLSSLGSTFNGLTNKTSKDFGIGDSFITYLQVFNNNCSDLNFCAYVKISENDKQNKVRFGDILFTTSSETPEEVGTASVFFEKKIEPYLNSFCFGFRLNNFDVIDPRFAGYYFLGNNFRQSILPLAQGSTRFNLSKNSFLKLKIIIPPLKEQKKIASILTSVDEVIEKTQSQINKLQDLKKGTMNELLTRGIGHAEFKNSLLGRIPKNWDVFYINDIAFVTKLAGFEYSEYFDYSIGGDIIAIRALNLKNAKLDLKEVQTIPKSVSDKLPRSKLQKGDLVISYVGTVGEVALIEKSEKFHLAPNVAKITPNQEKILPEFLLHNLMSNKTKKLIMLLGTITSQPSLNMGNIRKILISLPSVKEQRKICNIFSSIDNFIEIKIKKLKKYKSLKKSLMQDLLTGKVRVSVN